MKKIVFTLLAISLLASAMAQTSKCGIDTKALVREEVAAGAQSINFLAKMAPGFDRDVLEKADIVIGAEAGQIVTLRVPVRSLEVLENDKEVLLYSISHRIAEPTCDRMRGDTRTDSVQNGLGTTDDISYNGEGVFIGITDWGFDYTHPNYNGQNHKNWRIARAWDHFRLAGPPPAGFDFGTEIVGHDDLKEALGDTSNLYGYGTHGTHVAGITAGKGFRGKLRGQAPGARLLLCSFGLGEYEWMQGVAWMRKVAQDSARRLVINSSWGMYSFSCIDGRSLLSEAINNWAADGTIFCTSAGNNGDVKFHISKTFTSATDTLKTVATYYDYVAEAIGQCLIMWGEEGHDFSAQFRMAIADTTGTYWAGPVINTADGDQIVYDTLVCGDIRIPYRIMAEHANPYDQRPHIQMDVNKDAALKLQLLITAESGTVHAWNVANKTNHAGNEGADFVSNPNFPGYVGGDALYGIGEPGCAEGNITVAAHSSDFWNGDTTVYTTGSLAYFSSYGPIIDGRQKPDISAPGVSVLSSISRWADNASSYTSHLIFNEDGYNYKWSNMSGTSMSSPSVTGIVALLLQANPNLSYSQIKDIIHITARNDDKTGPLVANDSADLRWGWGKIDALAAINEAVRRVSINTAEEHRLPLRLYPNPTTGSVNLFTGCGEEQTMEIYGIDGRTVDHRQVREQTTIDTSRWPRGVYIVRVGSRTEKLIVR